MKGSGYPNKTLSPIEYVVIMFARFRDEHDLFFLEARLRFPECVDVALAAQLTIHVPLLRTSVCRSACLNIADED